VTRSFERPFRGSQFGESADRSGSNATAEADSWIARELSRTAAFGSIYVASDQFDYSWLAICYPRQRPMPGWCACRWCMV